ncbi:MAG: DUF559 domain-containing protein [Chitinophagaceae bacterium]
MKTYAQASNCQNCSCRIEETVFDYSMEHYDFALCTLCQDWLKNKMDETSQETIYLYLSLRTRNVPASLEKSDAYKTTDIAVIDAKVNIEVDGPQYNSNPGQALSDLERTYASFKKGYLTLRIPHSLVRKNLDQTADCITEFLNVSRQKNDSQ